MRKQLKVIFQYIVATAIFFALWAGIYGFFVGDKHLEENAPAIPVEFPGGGKEWYIKEDFSQISNNRFIRYYVSPYSNGEGLIAFFCAYIERMSLGGIVIETKVHMGAPKGARALVWFQNEEGAGLGVEAVVFDDTTIIAQKEHGFVNFLTDSKTATITIVTEEFIITQTIPINGNSIDVTNQIISCNEVT